MWGARWCCSSSEPGARVATRSFLHWLGGQSPGGCRKSAVEHQGHRGGQLETPSSAQSFIRQAGVSFPVAYDPNTDITQQNFGFDGNPYAVFIKGDGTIDKIVQGAVMTPSSLAADERALIPSGT